MEYRVVNYFVTSNDSTFKIGQIADGEIFREGFREWLIEYGYIEEVKESGEIELLNTVTDLKAGDYNRNDIALGNKINEIIDKLSSMKNGKNNRYG